RMRRRWVPPGAAPIARAGEPFWPRQALYDAAFSLLLLAALFAVALEAGAPLTGPADPAGAANPRPEWDFRPLFEALKVLPEWTAFLLPLAAAVFLFGLPLIDRSARTRMPVLALLAGGFLAAAGLTIASYRTDAGDPRFVQAESLARSRAQKALKLARTHGVPPEGALALLMNQPDERGGRLFARACTECHSVRGNGGPKAPQLD